METGSHASRSRQGSASGSGVVSQATAQAATGGDVSPSKSRTPSGKRKGKGAEAEQAQPDDPQSEQVPNKPRWGPLPSYHTHEMFDFRKWFEKYRGEKRTNFSPLVVACVSHNVQGTMFAFSLTLYE